MQFSFQNYVFHLKLIFIYEKNFLILTVLFFIFSQTNAQSEITKNELFKHVELLASDELKGRKAGTTKGKESAVYIRDQFKECGAELMGENGFQYFEILTGIKLGKGNYMKIGDFKAKTFEDNIPFSFSGNGKLEAEVVFVGYGFDIDTETMKWNDYEKVSVKDKWVLIFRGDQEMQNRESEFIPYSSDRAKVLTAIDKGAAGVIFVSGQTFDKKDNLPELKVGRGNAQTQIPVIQIKNYLANKILEKKGKKIIDLENFMIDNLQPNSFETGVTVDAKTNVEYVKARTQNVVAIVRGSDPKLKDEYIIIGAHYDHLGMGGKGSGSRKPDTTAVHNGADDNASGVASIIEIAEKFASLEIKTKRSIIFIAFGAEEIGLLGSSYFTNNPLVDLSKIYVMFNLDMIGKLDTEKPILTIAGTGTAEEFDDFLNKYEENTKIEFAFSPGGYGASDHSSFYTKNISVLFFNTGAHQDYHTPEDDTKYLNFEGQEQVSRLIYEMAFEFAENSEKLTYKESGIKNSGAKPTRGFKVTLGIMPGFGDTENKGLRVDGVTKGRPAEIGGIIKGDVITAIDGKQILNIYDYMARLGECKEGQTINVDVNRNGEKIVLRIQL